MKVYVLTEDIDDGRGHFLTFIRGVYAHEMKAHQDGMLLPEWHDVVEVELNMEESK